MQLNIQVSSPGERFVHEVSVGGCWHVDGLYETWRESGEKGEAAENSTLASSVARGWGGASSTGAEL